MNTAESRALLAYNTWANERMIVDVRPLDPSELTRDLQTSFSSILGTIAHIYWAEWLWVRRWRHESPKIASPPCDHYKTLDEVVKPWREVQADQEKFVADLSDVRLRERISYENVRNETWEYSLSAMMQHLFNHSTYHRGQVVTLLRQIGRKPRSQDLLVWIDEADGNKMM